jgi:hypothetical protein
MFMQCGCGLGSGVSVQILFRMFVDVHRLFAWGMNVRMRMLVGVGVLVCMGMHDPIGVRMLMRVDVGMDVGVGMIVFDLLCHGVFLLWTGEKNDLVGYRRAAIGSQQPSYSMQRGNTEPTCGSPNVPNS